MDILALIITLLIIATGLFSGICLFLMLRKEGGGKIKKGIEIFCKGQIKRLKAEKSEIDEIKYFYPAGAIAIKNLEISVYELFIKN